MSSDLHTILTRNARAIVVAKENERLGIEQHVGHYIVQWGFLDLVIGMAIPVWDRRLGLKTRQQDVERLRASEKIKRLRAAFPNGWLDGQTLLRELVEGNDYRNALAHWNLGMSGQHEGQSYEWHFWRIRSGKPVIELDPEFMARQGTRVEVLHQAVLSSMRSPFCDGTDGYSMNAHSLAEPIVASPGIWRTDDDRAAFVSLANDLFPTRKSSAP